MTESIWRGVHSAITTKLDEDENVDLDAVRADVAFQIEGGVDAVICCGSLGEASTLVADEKIAIARAAKEAAAGRVPVMLTIAEDSTRAGARLAERAAELELDGLMVLPAMRYVSTPRETMRHFRTHGRGHRPADHGLQQPGRLRASTSRRRCSPSSPTSRTSWR